MAETDARINRFIDRFGRYFEDVGASRSAGQILAYLLISEQPQSLDDLAGALHISKASASLGTRLWDYFGFVERVNVRGDRKVYYQLRPNLGHAFADAALTKFDALAELAEEGRTAVGEGRPKAQARLGEFARIYRYLTKRVPDILRELEKE